MQSITHFFLPLILFNLIPFSFSEGRQSSWKEVSPGEYEFFINEKQVSREEYLEYHRELGREARKLVDLTDEDRAVFDMIRVYNRTGNEELLNKILELLYSSEKYKGNVIARLQLNEQTLPLFLDYIKQEENSELRRDAVLSLSRAEPVEEVFELLESIDRFDLAWHSAQLVTSSLNRKKEKAKISNSTEEKAPPNQVVSEKSSNWWVWLIGILVVVGGAILLRPKSGK